MTRYHINKKGEPGVCKAMVSCPFGDLTDDHYESVEAAREAFETRYSKFQAVDEKVTPATLHQIFSSYFARNDETLGEIFESNTLVTAVNPSLNPGLIYAAYIIPTLSEDTRAKFYNLPASFYSVFETTHKNKGYSTSGIRDLILMASELHAGKPTWRPAPVEVTPRSIAKYRSQSSEIVDMQNVSPRTASLLDAYAKLRFGEDQSGAFWSTVESNSTNKPKLSDYARALKKFSKTGK